LLKTASHLYGQDGKDEDGRMGDAHGCLDPSV
jgi:hypothetical protein